MNARQVIIHVRVAAPASTRWEATLAPVAQDTPEITVKLVRHFANMAKRAPLLHYKRV